MSSGESGEGSSPTERDIADASENHDQTNTFSSSQDGDSDSSDEFHFDKEKDDSQFNDVKFIDLYPRYKGDCKMPVRFSRRC